MGRGREANTDHPHPYMEAHTVAKAGRQPDGGAEHRQLGPPASQLDFNTGLGLDMERDAARFLAMEPRRPHSELGKLL